jgi:hypothetical protein
MIYLSAALCVAVHAVVYFFDSMIYLTTADTEKHCAVCRRAAVVYFFDSRVYITTADTEKHSAVYRRECCGLFSKIQNSI